VKYTFRNRFKLQDGHHLDTGDLEEIKLADSRDDGLVVLKSAQRGERLISKADALAVEGTGYVDAETTARTGREWRRYLTVAFARDFEPVDFGPDDKLDPTVDKVYDKDPPDFFQKIGVKVGDRIIWDDCRLLVFPTEPTPRFISEAMGTADVTQSGWAERFEQKVAEARGRHGRPWNRQKTTAFSLVHSALADPNPETRHIQTVTAIESLLVTQDRPQNVLDGLDVLIAEVENWDEPALKQRILEILREAKEESITRSGTQQVDAWLSGEYGGKTAGDFFKVVYNMRSRLVHGERQGKKRPSVDKVRDVYAELRGFVLDLLDAYESG
jgi:Apea-like HEPN